MKEAERVKGNTLRAITREKTVKVVARILVQVICPFRKFEQI